MIFSDMATVMTEDHMAIITGNRTKLVQVLDFDLIVDDLLSQGVLNLMDQDKIKSKPTYKEKNRYLLDILPTKADTAYDKFINILKKHQEHVADLLKSPAKKVEQLLEDNTWSGKSIICKYF